MAGVLNVAVGVHHGDGCTCKPLDEITRTVTVQPVIVNRECPGQREIPRTDEITGRVIITWPAPAGPVLPAMGVAFHDADTGELVTTVVGMRLLVTARAGSGEVVEAHLEQLADDDDRPLPNGAKPVPNDGGDGVRTAVFRYAVAEMRIAGA
jgi:hypothetical protein